MESASSCSQIGSVASLELLNENPATTPVKDKKKSKKKKVTNNPPFKSREEAENQITEREAGKTYFPLAYLALKIMNT